MRDLTKPNRCRKVRVAEPPRLARMGSMQSGLGLFAALGDVLGLRVSARVEQLEHVLAGR